MHRDRAAIDGEVVAPQPPGSGTDQRGWLRGHLSDPAAAVALVGGAVLILTAAVGFSPVRAFGVVMLAAFAIGTRLRRSDTMTRRSPFGEPLVLLAVGVGALVLTQGGVGPMVHQASRLEWQTMAALAGYPFMAQALLTVVRRRVPGREVDVLVQAALVGFAVGLLLWAFVDGTSIAHSQPAVVVLPHIILVSLDVMLEVMALRLIFLPGEGVATYRLIAIALFYLTVGHLVSAAGVISDVRIPHAALVALAACSLSFLFFGLASLHPSAALLTEPSIVEPRPLSGGHVALLMAGMLMAPVVVASAALHHRAVAVATAVEVGLVASVLVAYMVVLLFERAVTEHRVHHDDLTGLANRTLVFDRINRAVAHARRNHSVVGVLFVDVDHFKDINDTFGHAAGDIVIRTVAERLEACLREEDSAARLAGDEFALLLPHLSGPDDVVIVAERVMKALKEPMTIAEVRIVATVSIGIALYPLDGATPEELVASADAAMYRAKEAGRNTYQIYSAELATRAHDRLAIETALYAGIERDELVLHYQPIVDGRTGQIVGAEALVRWEHPESGLLLPGHFVPVAEQSDLVVAMGEYVLTAACEQLAEWHHRGMEHLSVSVNVSARQFRYALASFVASTLRLSGLDPGSLILELTESAAVDNLKLVAATFDELHDMGVRSVIDDFGTGYSGLRYLGQLPVDGLKIDQSFVQGMSVTDASIIAATIAMAHSLGLTVVAEGIETEKQRQFLSSQGCDRMQGYFFAAPMPAAEFEALIFGPSASAVTPPPAIPPPEAIPLAATEPAVRHPAPI